MRGLDSSNGGWKDLAKGANAKTTNTSPQHIEHTLQATSEAQFQKLRLEIQKPATRWGVSVWQLQVLGWCS